MISLLFENKGGESKFAMAFLLPAEGSDVAAMLSSLSAELVCPDYTVREMDMEVCGNILCQLMNSIKSAF